MNVLGVTLLSSALHSLSMFLAIHSVVVDTGMTVSADWRVTPTLVLCGQNVCHVCNISCVAGALVLTILPSASVITETSPVFLLVIS